MPIYEYRCQKCGATFEKLQKVSDEPPAACPTCSGPVEKLVSRTAFQLKGTGWYVTDYARKSTGADGSGAKPSTDSKPAETSAASSSSTETSSGSGSETSSGSGSSSSAPAAGTTASPKPAADASGSKS